MKSVPTALMAGIWLLGACSSADEPRVQYQFCSELGRDRDAIKKTLVHLADRYQMHFLDRSADAERESRLIDEERGNVLQSYPLVMMTAWRESGLGATITNAGLPANQFVLGISGGSLGEHRMIASETVSEFSKHWKLVIVPDGKGARPLPDCAAPA